MNKHSQSAAALTPAQWQTVVSDQQLSQKSSAESDPSRTAVPDQSEHRVGHLGMAMLSDEPLYLTHTEGHTQVSGIHSHQRCLCNSSESSCQIYQRGPGANWRVPAPLTKGNYQDRQTDFNYSWGEKALRQWTEKRHEGTYLIVGLGEETGMQDAGWKLVCVTADLHETNKERQTHTQHTDH